jgi:hypothetical protein
MYNAKVSAALLSISTILRSIPIVGAQTPPEFIPVIPNHLNVVYGSINASPAGLTVAESGQYHLL